MRCAIGLLMGKLPKRPTKLESSLHRSLRQGQDLCSQVRPKIHLHLHKEMAMTTMSSWDQRLLGQTRGMLTC